LKPVKTMKSHLPQLRVSVGTIGLLALLTFCAPSDLSAQGAGTIGSAIASGRTELDAVQSELATLRDTVTKEKVPLASALREEEAKVLSLRREAERMQRVRDSGGIDLKNLEDQLKARMDEVEYISSLLGDYANRLHASLDSSEIALYGDRLLAIVNSVDTEGLSKEQLYNTQLDAVTLGLKRIKDLAGGMRFPGKAVLPDGRFEKGSFAILGPMVYFASDDGKTAGLAERSSSMEPRVVPLGDGMGEQIAAFVKSGTGNLPMDTTMGKAKAIATTKDTLAGHIAKGGVWMGPILFFAGLSLVFGVFKAIEISGFKRLRPGVLSEVFKALREGKPTEALAQLKKETGPSVEMLEEAVRNLHLPKELIEEFMYESMLSKQPKLERGLSFISITAAVAPLLGLLGTVTGMINTFKLITLFGTGDAKSLSSGISEALITTEFGLIVAIPALLMSAFLSRKASGILSEMEKTSIAFMNGVAAIQYGAQKQQETSATVPVA